MLLVEAAVELMMLDIMILYKMVQVVDIKAIKVAGLDHGLNIMRLVDLKLVEVTIMLSLVLLVLLVKEVIILKVNTVVTVEAAAGSAAVVLHVLTQVPVEVLVILETLY